LVVYLCVIKKPFRKLVALVGIAGETLRFSIPQVAGGTGNFRVVAHGNRDYVNSEIDLSLMKRKSRASVHIQELRRKLIIVLRKSIAPYLKVKLLGVDILHLPFNVSRKRKLGYAASFLD
jgi:hypothetical protein